MYGNGGTQGASTAGGKGMMPSAPTTNPVAMGLQLKGIELQNKAIESQNLLNTANAAKSVAEAKKIGGVDTQKAEMEIQWQGIENRIQASREAIEANNVNKSKAEADEAVEKLLKCYRDVHYFSFLGDFLFYKYCIGVLS